MEDLVDERLEKTANLSDLDDTSEALTNLGLENVDNTADADKPISDAQAAVNAELAAADDEVLAATEGLAADPHVVPGFSFA